MAQQLSKTVGGLLRKVKIGLSYNPATPLLHIYSKALKIRSQRVTCIAASLQQYWKHHHWPWMGKYPFIVLFTRVPLEVLSCCPALRILLIPSKESSTSCQSVFSLPACLPSPLHHLSFLSLNLLHIFSHVWRLRSVRFCLRVYHLYRAVNYWQARTHILFISVPRKIITDPVLIQVQ